MKLAKCKRQICIYFFNCCYSFLLQGYASKYQPRSTAHQRCSLELVCLHKLLALAIKSLFYLHNPMQTTKPNSNHTTNLRFYSILMTKFREPLESCKLKRKRKSSSSCLPSRNCILSEHWPEGFSSPRVDDTPLFHPKAVSGPDEAKYFRAFVQSRGY